MMPKTHRIHKTNSSLGLGVLLALVVGLAMGMSGCENTAGSSAGDVPTTHEGHDQDDDQVHNHRPGSTPGESLVAIPEAVRRNLGITFVAAEPRRVERTLRVPGSFEYLPNARRAYRMPVPGRVEMLVEQFQEVEEGDLLCRVDSLAWHDLQQSLVEAGATIARLKLRIENYAPLLESHEAHEASLSTSIGVLEERVAQLERVRQAGGGRGDELSQARAALANARSELASLEEKHVELQADRDQAVIDIEAARARERLLLGSAATILGVSRETLTRRVELDGRSAPWWSRVDSVEVRATRAGVVEHLDLTSGSWGEQGEGLLEVVRPEMLRFRALGLQSDLGALRPGLPVRIVPPAPGGGGVDPGRAMSGALRLGLTANPEERTVELYVTPDTLRPWARQGVSAQLEIVTDASERAAPCVPLGAVQRDGLRPVVFVRDPFDPESALRVPVTLGRDDGRWVEILDGVEIGNEVVLNGAFQLLLATSETTQQGGHFHPDGTFHGGEED